MQIHPRGDSYGLKSECPNRLRRWSAGPHMCILILSCPQRSFSVSPDYRSDNMLQQLSFFFFFFCFPTINFLCFGLAGAASTFLLTFPHLDVWNQLDLCYCLYSVVWTLSHIFLFKGKQFYNFIQADDVFNLAACQWPHNPFTPHPTAVTSGETQKTPGNTSGSEMRSQQVIILLGNVTCVTNIT